jgi:hypothetical protein
MTRFISTRTHDVGGAVVAAFALESDGGADPVYTTLPDAQIERETAGLDVILAIHGFNISRQKGVRSLAALEAALTLSPGQVFYGVLWPGDFWLPVVNYPSEAGDAERSGAYVADYLNAHMPRAASYALISHSLGGRVLLEAVKGLKRPARELCITAGAVDDDCLSTQYTAAKANAGRTSVLASAKDKVLGLAYPLGDFLSDVFWGDEDSPWHGALGLHGPKPFEPPPKVAARQIPDSQGYGHGDYFPPSDLSVSPPDARWRRAADYMRRSVNGAPDSW